MSASKQDILKLQPTQLKTLLLSNKGPETAEKLSLDSRLKQTEESLIKAIDTAVPNETTQLSSLLLNHHMFKKNLELLWSFINNSDPTCRAVLHRNIFPDIFESGPEYQAMYAALTITSDSDRSNYLAGLKTALTKNDRKKIISMRDKVLNLSVPDGFSMLKPVIGAGKSSRISLLQKNEDNTLYVWKQPANDSDKVKNEFHQLVKRSSIWQQLGISKGEIFWAPDNKSILQQYIDGFTLRHAFKHTTLLTDPDHPLLPSLIKIFQQMVSNKIFISGLNTENFIFGQSNWSIIDSGSISRMSSPQLVWKRQYERLSRHWTRFDNTPKSSARTFLKRIETGLDLPDKSLFRDILTKLSLKTGWNNKKLVG